MRPHILALAFLVTVLLDRPGSAGVFFQRGPKPNPAERVPQLIVTLRTDLDDRKREAAARELRDFDPTAFPDLVPALIDALLTDPKTSVRIEAAQSLGKLRPVNPRVGLALEQAAGNDSSIRVRLQCRATLMHYRLAGYSTKGKIEEKTTPIATPAAVGPAMPLPHKPVIVPIVPNTRGPETLPETPPPPLADPLPAAPLRRDPTTEPPGLPKAPSEPREGPSLGSLDQIACEEVRAESAAAEGELKLVEATSHRPYQAISRSSSPWSPRICRHST